MSTTLTTIVTFTGPNGAEPYAGLITDSKGDLLGTTAGDGTDNSGTVFELVNSASGYSSTPTILATLNATIGSTPLGGLVADANGDLFGTTLTGGTSNDGTVFEIVNSASGYASTPVTLVDFDALNGNAPLAGLTIDASGDLFGTTVTGGTSNVGTVFEIANSTTGYASMPTTLYAFGGPDGAYPEDGLITDANGDLFGTTSGDEESNDGTVFEIVKSNSGYASSLTTLATFVDTNGNAPIAGLLADANGDLFGTTEVGGTGGDGTVFEITNSASGYASAPVTLASFGGANGAYPYGGLIADANGDLFGTTAGDGTDDDGTVFEIVNSAAGYASTPTILASFDFTNGAGPFGTLLLENGELIGTTAGGGASSEGTVFEVPACYLRNTAIATTAGDVAVECLAIGDLVLTATGAVAPVRWIGRRSYAGRFLAANPGVQPIRFTAGSLGNGLPLRDLLISPEHAMFIDGVLVPARHLTNGTTIVQDRSLSRVDYFHIELEQHGIILAEGAPSETFVDDDSQSRFHNAAERRVLHPSRERVPARYCAPRVESGFKLDVIRRRLASVANEAAQAA